MSQLNIKPLADRVLVEPAAAETTTSSGIIIPDTARETPTEQWLQLVQELKTIPLLFKWAIQFFTENMQEQN